MVFIELHNNTTGSSNSNQILWLETIFSFRPLNLSFQLNYQNSKCAAITWNLVYIMANINSLEPTRRGVFCCGFVVCLGFFKCEMCLNISIPDYTKYVSVTSPKQFFESTQSCLFMYFLHLPNSVSEKARRNKIWAELFQRTHAQSNTHKGKTQHIWIRLNVYFDKHLWHLNRTRSITAASKNIDERFDFSGWGFRVFAIVELRKLEISSTCVYLTACLTYSFINFWFGLGMSTTKSPLPQVTWTMVTEKRTST